MKQISFGEKTIIKNVFHKVQIPINIYKLNMKRIVLSDKESYGNKDSFKYFTGYIHKGNVFLAQLCIKFLQKNGYSKYFYKNNKYMNLLVHDKEIVEKYNKICNKFNNERGYNNEYIKTRINIAMIEYIQILSIIKYQKIMNIAHVYL